LLRATVDMLHACGLHALVEIKVALALPLA